MTHLPADVDEDCGALHLTEEGLVAQLLGVRGEGAGHHDKVALRQQRVQGHCSAPHQRQRG